MDSFKTWYLNVFWVAESKENIKIQNTREPKLQKMIETSWGLLGFLCRWIQERQHNPKITNGGSNSVIRNSKIQPILINLGILGCFWLLVFGFDLSLTWFVTCNQVQYYLWHVIRSNIIWEMQSGSILHCRKIPNLVSLFPGFRIP